MRDGSQCYAATDDKPSQFRSFLRRGRGCRCCRVLDEPSRGGRRDGRVRRRVSPADQDRPSIRPPLLLEEPVVGLRGLHDRGEFRPQDVQGIRRDYRQGSGGDRGIPARSGARFRRSYQGRRADLPYRGARQDRRRPQGARGAGKQTLFVINGNHDINNDDKRPTSPAMSQSIPTWSIPSHSRTCGPIAATMPPSRSSMRAARAAVASPTWCVPSRASR